MTKLLENIYRCVNIALVNELKQLCLRMDIDLFEVINAAQTKPFGFQAFYPGPGAGRPLHPHRSVLLSWKAKQFDFHTRFIELAARSTAICPTSSWTRPSPPSTIAASRSRARRSSSLASLTKKMWMICANPRARHH